MVFTETQDLTFLKWSHIRNSSGTAGTFLKSQSVLAGKKIYYKLSNFDPAQGVIGHECINEIIADKKSIIQHALKASDKSVLFDGLQDAISDVFRDMIWKMIYERYSAYEAL